MLTFTTLTLWLHVAAVVVWVGGLFAVSFVFVPVVRTGIESPALAARLAAAVMGRFARISREMIFLIALTGVFNLISAGNARGFHFSTTYIAALLAKVILFAAIVGIQAWQCLRLTPALVSHASGSNPGTDPVPVPLETLKRRAVVSSVVNFVLGLSVILLGLGLRYW